MSNIPQCAHLHIERRQKEERPGFIVGEWWECRDCGTHFVAVTRFPEAAPENAKEVCGMGDDNCRDGVTACTRYKGHPGKHYSVYADRTWPNGPTPSVSAEPDGRCPVVINGARCILSTRPHDKHTAYPHPHPAPPSEAPAMECRTCDGTGWTEGGTAIKTSCRACKGLGVAAARPEAEPVSEALRDMVGRSLRPCTACACERCQAKEAFVRVLAQAYFDAEANRVVLKHSDLFLAAKALLAKEGA